MRIFQITPEYARGGGELIARNLHEGALAQGHESTLVVISGKDVRESASVVSLHGSGPRDLRTVFELHRLVDGCNKPIVHTHMYSAQLFGATLPRGNIRLVTTEHNTHNRRRNWPGFRWIDRRMYQRYSRIVAISQPVADALCDWCEDTRSRLVTIPNGVNTTAVRFVAQAPAGIRLVSVGRLEEQKNFGVSIVAVATLIDQGYDITYDIFGEGSQHAELRSLIAERGHLDRIRLLGWSNEISSRLADYSGMVAPSVWEGFGLAVIEGMAAGLPVVCSNVRGMADVVEGGPALSFMPQRPSDLVEVLGKALDAGYFCENGNRHAAHRHAARYDFGETMRKYLELYDEICRS